MEGKMVLSATLKKVRSFEVRAEQEPAFEGKGRGSRRVEDW